jgi:hypothetical protein
LRLATDALAGVDTSFPVTQLAGRDPAEHVSGQ